MNCMFDNVVLDMYCIDNIISHCGSGQELYIYLTMFQVL
jgi:hypothetical protein